MYEVLLWQCVRNFKNIEKINNLIRTYKLNRDVIIEEYTTIFSVKSR